MECPVCFEIFETPLLLPGCGHTICRACAEMLITEGNFLRCPECRLVYQLRQGIKSLPKNVALERTIEEHSVSTGKSNVMCEEHPDDAVALYCKTCEKSICLKCYFTSNTLRKGQSTHNGHQVDTSEDAFTKERRMLEERRREYGEKRTKEREYVNKLEKTDEELKKLLEDKTAEIEKKKNEIISQVKQTSNKLKFTLKGSMVRDSEFLQMALQSARDRLEKLDILMEDADSVLIKAAMLDGLEVNELKETRKALEDLPDPSTTEKPAIESFMKIASFDTNIKPCLEDPRKALSYQTECPRTPELIKEDCVISDKSAYIVIKYNETVRVKSMKVYYREAMYKGFSEKKWESNDVEDIAKGYGKLVLRGLEQGTMYRMYATATNDCGDSPPSNELWFRTVDAEVEKRTT